jgi:hydroxyacylglutathione hydrolase
MITVKTFVFNAFQENTYLLYDHTRRCKVFDPGMNNENEQLEFNEYIRSNGLELEAIVNTHCHVDHVLGCQYLKKKYNIPFFIHKMELNMLRDASSYGDFFGLQVEDPPAPDQYYSEGDIVQIGEGVLSVVHIPGHSIGSIAFYSPEDNFIITGDVLFKGSIGRTDLSGGDYNVLIESIRSKIFILPEQTLVFPGHGPSTTVGDEIKTNPFFN